MKRQVEALCGLGNRFVGSPGERAARELIVRELREAGVPGVRCEELEVPGYELRAASCELVGAPGLRIPATGLQFTASGAGEAEAVFIGSPRSVADVQALEAHGLELTGRIAIADTYWPYAIGDYLVAAGVVGVVVVSPNPDGLLAHFTARLYPPVADGEGLRNRPLAIPGVTVERRAGSTLVALAGGGGRVLRIAHEAGYSPVTTANVIGEVPGRELPHERVVIGAHYDSQREGVGACDNATGVAALLAIARACAAAPRRRTVVLAALADEEHGFNGAVDYCRRHEATLDDTRAMVCLDALAWVYPGRRSLHADPSLQAYAAARATELGWGPDEIVDASVVLGSDHNAFIDAGVPACWFWRYPPQHPGYHSSGDAPELLDYRLVAETAEVAAYTALRLADDPDPGPGRSRPTTRWLDLRPRRASLLSATGEARARE